jgi:hypothetical protein
MKVFDPMLLLLGRSGPQHKNLTTHLIAQQQNPSFN